MYHTQYDNKSDEDLIIENQNIQIELIKKINDNIEFIKWMALVWLSIIAGILFAMVVN